MVRGRTTAPEGLVLGHEITGEVVEVGPGVEFIKVGDLCSVPFNIACGRCRNCKEGKTGICLNVNPDRPGSAYGYVDMGGWVGGQAEYVLVPYADWNLLKFPDKDQAMEKILDLTMLSDIFPTGYHGAYTRGRRHRVDASTSPAPGPVGLAAAHSAHAARRGGRHRRRPERRTGWPQAAQLRLRDRRRLQGRPEGPDRADPRRARGRLRRRRGRLRGARPRRRGDRGGAGHGAELADGRHPRGAARSASRACTSPATRAPSTTRPRWARCRSGSASAGPSRTSFTTGQCPVMRYHRGADEGDPARPGAHRRRRSTRRSIPLDEAPQGYADFDKGAASKFVLDPHGMIGQRATG